MIDKVEPFKNTIHSSSSDYNEYHMNIKDDHGAGSLVAVCSLAKKDDRKIYLSGSGADELFSDYGLVGPRSILTATLVVFSLMTFQLSFLGHLSMAVRKKHTSQKKNTSQDLLVLRPDTRTWINMSYKSFFHLLLS